MEWLEKEKKFQQSVEELAYIYLSLLAVKATDIYTGFDYKVLQVKIAETKAMSQVMSDLQEYLRQRLVYSGLEIVSTSQSQNTNSINLANCSDNYLEVVCGQNDWQMAIIIKINPHTKKISLICQHFVLEDEFDFLIETEPKETLLPLLEPIFFEVTFSNPSLLPENIEKAFAYINQHLQQNSSRDLAIQIGVEALEKEIITRLQLNRFVIQKQEKSREKWTNIFTIITDFSFIENKKEVYKLVVVADFGNQKVVVYEIYQENQKPVYMQNFDEQSEFEDYLQTMIEDLQEDHTKINENRKDSF